MYVYRPEGRQDLRWWPERSTPTSDGEAPLSRLPARRRPRRRRPKSRGRFITHRRYQKRKSVGPGLYVRPLIGGGAGGAEPGGMRPTGPSVPPGSCRPSGHRFVESHPRAAEYRKSLTSYRPFHSPTILGSAYRGEPSTMSLFLASEATCVRTLRETGGRWCH